ncbi:MAG: arsenic efflux protein, partial [Acutalibacteraceae bacterium]
MLDVLLDALIDSLKMLPFLFAAYFLIEYLEHKASEKMTRSLQSLGPWGPVGGAVLGIVPQCGFSVAAANFYAGRLISLGTLLAVFIATSDEAIPI